MQRPGWIDFIKKFWLLFIFAAFLIHGGLRSGALGYDRLPELALLAALLTGLLFLAWRGWSSRRTDRGAAEAFDRLFGTGLPLAKQQLEKQGAFLPFGVTMGGNGKLALNAGFSDSQDGQEALQLLLHGLRAQARKGDFSALAIFAQVSVTEAGGRLNAIAATLEHRKLPAMKVYVPYEKNEHGQYQFGEPFRAPSTKQIFEE